MTTILKNLKIRDKGITVDSRDVLVLQGEPGEAGKKGSGGEPGTNVSKETF